MTVKWIEDFIKENDVFYDIGANIGAYSFVAFINTKGKCKIYAFEPGFDTFKSLCYNISINHFQNKIIPFPLNIPLSDSSGVDEFKYAELNSGSSIHPGINREDKKYGFSQKIIKYTLDDIIDKMELDLPNYLKIDVDGHEFSVLSGAKKILKSEVL